MLLIPLSWKQPCTEQKNPSWSPFSPKVHWDRLGAFIRFVPSPVLKVFPAMPQPLSCALSLRRFPKAVYMPV